MGTKSTVRWRGFPLDRTGCKATAVYRDPPRGRIRDDHEDYLSCKSHLDEIVPGPWSGLMDHVPLHQQTEPT